MHRLPVQQERVHILVQAEDLLELVHRLPVQQQRGRTLVLVEDLELPVQQLVRILEVRGQPLRNWHKPEREVGVELGSLQS